MTLSSLVGEQRNVARMVYCAELWAVNANWYDDGWNLNANSVENPNPWNAGNQVCSRNSYLPSARIAEVFLIISFLHAPTLFPIVSRLVPKDMNCSFDINLFSHNNWMKNFISSILTTAISSKGIFCFGSVNEALRRAVNKSRNALSILFPRPNRSVRGIFLCITIHDV